MPALAPDRTEIPDTIALPPAGATGAASSKVAALYRELHRLDPGLLPPEAVDIARASHAFQTMAPKLGTKVTDEIARWRGEVSRAAAAGEPLPSYDQLVKVIVEESAARKLNTLFRAEWGHAIRGITAVMVAAGDDIVEQLKPRHDEAWQRFREHSGQLAAFTEESQILGNPSASDEYHAAGSALSQFSAIRAIRYRLNELPKYAITNCEAELVLFQRPEAMRGVTLPKPPLQRWAAIREHYLEAQPWLPLRGEVEELRDRRAYERKAARYA